MCKKETYTLRVTNRGTNVYESGLRTTYEVNIPSHLRNGKMCMMTLVQGTISIKTDNSTFHNINELGVQTNLPIMDLIQRSQAVFLVIILQLYLM